MALVHIPQLLRPLAGGAERVQIEGSSLRDIVAGLEKIYPGLRGRIADEGGIRPEILLAIGANEAFDLNTAVGPTDEVHILPAIAGGAPHQR